MHRPRARDESGAQRARPARGGNPSSGSTLRFRRRVDLSGDIRPAARTQKLRTESAFAVLERAQQLAREGRDIINLGIGQPDFPVPDHVREAAARAAKDGPFGYGSAQGDLELREAVAARHASEGAMVSPEQVVILPGAKVGLLFAALCFGEIGAEILYPDPGFPIYPSVIELSGALPVPYPLTESHSFGLRADDVLERLTPATRLVMINSPGNPTGGVASDTELDRLVAGLAAHPQVAVLSDEIYRPLYYDGSPPKSLLAYSELEERLILLDGWSKTYAMTGWRLGYTIWPPSLVDTAIRLCVNNHSCVNNVAQAAGLAALTGPQDEREHMVSAFGRRRQVLLDGLAKIPGWQTQTPRGAFYTFPNIGGTGASAAALQTALLEEAGVATIAGTSFGEGGAGHLRLSFAASEEALRAACSRIESYVRGSS